ncbi:MAG: hypothetical protein ISS89_00830 [Candidatus Omnitrophica bacterium]|nr:hypothetical protein [Candidatus Omnitrophota bacterium]
MLKKNVFLLFIFLSVLIACRPAGAELLEKGQSSEQVLTYDRDAEGGNVAQETPQPYMGGIEEYPYTTMPDTTLREDATDDTGIQEYPAPDVTLREDVFDDSDVQESAGPDTTLREVPMTESAGPDTTLREKATDDSGVQESAEPPTPDIFAPKKKSY